MLWVIGACENSSLKYVTNYGTYLEAVQMGQDIVYNRHRVPSMNPHALLTHLTQLT